MGCSSLEGVGTSTTGFSTLGPFSCKVCVHSKDCNGSKVCTHPKVNKDPELRNRKREGDFIIVASTDCCDYVRPCTAPKGKMSENYSKG